MNNRIYPTLLVLALHLLVLGGPRLARAQESGSSSRPAATDTSWFAKYHPGAQDTLSPATYQGWKQFQLNCSRCHGQDAQGTSFAPSPAQALGKGGPVSTEAAFLQRMPRPRQGSGR